MQWKFILDNSIEGSLPLSDEPIGWADVVFNIKRNMQWHGIFFEYAINLRFYAEGYDYIKNIYDTQGIEAQITISIQMKCTDTDSFTSFFEGKLVVPKCIFDCKDDCIVSVPIEQAGCLMKFKNRINQSVDLNANTDFDGNALSIYSKLPFDLTLKPKAIILRSFMEYFLNGNPPETNNTAQTIASGLSGDTQHIDDSMVLQIPIGNVIVNELSLDDEGASWAATSAGLAVNETLPYTATYTFVVQLRDVFIGVKSSRDGKLCCCGYPTTDGTSLDELNAYLNLEINGTIVASVHFHHTTGCNHTPIKWITGNLDATPTITYVAALGAGATMKAYVEVDAHGDYHRENIFTSIPIFFTYGTSGSSLDAKVSVKAVVLNPSTPCKAYAINEALSRTVESVTDDCMRVKSDYFGRTDSEPYASDADGCGSLEVITKGLLIRQFPTNIPVSFQDIFDALNAIHNIGMGLEPDTERAGGHDWVRVEPMEYFYDSAIIFTVDNVPEIKKTVQPDWFTSLYEFGYDKWETENSMGLDEICTKRSYRSTLSEVQKTVTQICKFIASGYSIEVTRNKEFVNDSTKDWRLDNDIFIICVRRDGGDLVVEQGQDCADMGTITDIIEPTTIYNYRISPVRNFLRWIKAFMGNYFNAVTGPNSKFIFTKGEGNFLEEGKLVTGCIWEGSEIGESDEIKQSNFASEAQSHPIYKFETDEFDYPLSINELATIKANPIGLIQYRKKSTDSWSYGYIMNIQYKPNDGIATFVLLPQWIKP